PGIGAKTAERLAYHVMKMPKEKVLKLAQAVRDVAEKVGRCSRCHNMSETDPCGICGDAGRKRDTICVVEEPKDVLALEATGSYRGLYHVLMGRIAPLDGVNPEDLRLQELVDRVRKTRPREAIIATGSDADGETTALYVARVLKPLAIKVTRIAAGVPVGSSLDFVDPATLSKALENRRDVLG
ncbi:MAG: recombination mediator RecR, partial [Candidatus Aureabacteria bacterium]|nr:recombination mediator RecR [Candidatus Auribacterota bacterium]